MASHHALNGIIVCALLRRIDLPGEIPGRLPVVPAESTWGGSGGDEWAEALQEKAVLDGQRTMQAAARANTEQASKRRCGSRPAIITGKADVSREVNDTGT
jgi:hypothetical protein